MITIPEPLILYSNTEMKYDPHYHQIHPDTRQIDLNSNSIVYASPILFYNHSGGVAMKGRIFFNM